jgi:hypothetical protein
MDRHVIVKVRKDYKEWWADQYEQTASVFKKAKVDWADVRTDQDYVKPLMNLFKNR